MGCSWAGPAAQRGGRQRNRSAKAAEGDHRLAKSSAAIFRQRGQTLAAGRSRGAPGVAPSAVAGAARDAGSGRVRPPGVRVHVRGRRGRGDVDGEAVPARGRRDGQRALWRCRRARRRPCSGRCAGRPSPGRPASANVARAARRERAERPGVDVGRLAAAGRADFLAFDGRLAIAPGPRSTTQTGRLSGGQFGVVASVVERVERDRDVRHRAQCRRCAPAVRARVCRAIDCMAGKLARTTCIVKVAFGSSASWRLPPPHPRDSSAHARRSEHEQRAASGWTPRARHGAAHKRLRPPLTIAPRYQRRWRAVTARRTALLQRCAALAVAYGGRIA